MLKRASLFLMLPAFLFLSFKELRGQAASSPFSSFGLGDFNGSALVNNYGMAGAGVSNPQAWYLNNLNPSMLVYNRLTVFQAGLLLEKTNLSTGDQTSKATNGNVNYLALGFPVKWNKSRTAIAWGSAVGLMPYTNMSYRIKSQGTVPGTLTTTYLSEKSEGGFNQLYWSNGVRINKSLSVGMKASYLFSSIISDFTNVVGLADQASRYQIALHEVLSVSGARFMPSVHYRIDSVGGRFFFNVGATYEIAKKVNSTLFQKIERKNSSGTILQYDSLLNSNSRINFPGILNAGISFGNSDKWVVAADYALIRFEGNQAQVGADRFTVNTGTKLTLGAEFTPDARSMTSVLKRITYRTGVSTEKSPYLVNGNTLKDMGVNFGFSLPVNRISSLDLAVRFGKRGDRALNGLLENYFKVYFGVTFNDQWFIKSRFD
jgi:hypothetical protein